MSSSLQKSIDLTQVTAQASARAARRSSNSRHFGRSPAAAAETLQRQVVFRDCGDGILMFKKECISSVYFFWVSIHVYQINIYIYICMYVFKNRERLIMYDYVHSYIINQFVCLFYCRLFLTIGSLLSIFPWIFTKGTVRGRSWGVFLFTVQAAFFSEKGWKVIILKFNFLESHLYLFLYLPSWWFHQPIWKICSSNWIISPKHSGWKYKIFETTN